MTSSASTTPDVVAGLLRSGIAASRAGHDEWARELLLWVLELDGDCLSAWLWLSGVVRSPQEKADCLRQVLRLDPDHELARRGLAHLRRQGQAGERPAVGEPLVTEATPADAGYGGPPSLEGVPWQRAPGVARPEAPSSADRPPPELGVDVERFILPVPGLEELLAPAIAAAQAGRNEQARTLLARILEVNQQSVSAWLWMSYVAGSERERDVYVDRAMNLAGAGASPRPSPAPARSRPVPVGVGAAASTLSTPNVNLPPAGTLYQSLLAALTGAPWRTTTLPLEQAGTRVLLAVGYLAGIAFAETVITFASPQAGLVAHSLLLLALLLHSALVAPLEERNLWASLAFAPLIRILSLSLPLAELPILSWYLITSVPLFAAAFVASRALGYSWRDLGLHLRGWPLQVAIGLTGLLFGALEYLILRPEPLAQGLDPVYLWRPALILLVSTGLLEEMIFRGLMQRAAVGALAVPGIVFVALVFAALHIGYRSLLDVAFVLAVGLFFGWVVHRTRSLLGVTLSHGLTNIGLFLLMPYLFP
ncbi:MAG: lysostaphin resistance A-like protein [Anaerolineae bacterium]